MDAGRNEERRKLDSLRMEYQKQKETPYEVLVYESLKQKILSGGYAAGEKIPEQSVSEELGVSRSPLRSAIRRLASEGLIEYYPYRGAFVKAYTDKDIHDAFAIRILHPSPVEKLPELDGPVRQRASAWVVRHGVHELFHVLCHRGFPFLGLTVTSVTPSPSYVKPPLRNRHVRRRVTWVGYFGVPTIYIFFLANFFENVLKRVDG